MSVPAIKARLGNTNYYIVSMKIGELTDRARILSEQTAWKDTTIEELYQRQINYNRVEKQIAPYLAKIKSRFFGSVILAAINFDEDRFESLEDLAGAGLVQRPSKAYRGATSGVGVITFSGGEVLTPLDGQHRIKALKYAISGMNDKGEKLPFDSDADLANEDVCVILVPHELRRSRKIFTTVNKYAKNTTTSENIIVNDDDVIACITRKVANEIIGANLVNIESNTLKGRTGCFTTLTTIYYITEAILTSKFGLFSANDKKSLPERSTVKTYENAAENFWEKITKDIDKWRLALEDKSSNGDSYRIEMRKTNLLGKPTAQQVIADAYIRLRTAGMSHNKICQRLNKIYLTIPADPAARPDWYSVCMTAGNNMHNKLMPLAARLIAYIAGEDLTKAQKDKLLAEYQRHHWDQGASNVKLPPQVKA